MKKAVKYPFLDDIPEDLVLKIERLYKIYAKLGLQEQSDVPDTLMNYPSTISSLSTYDVADLHANYTAWSGFTSDKFKYLMAATLVLKSELESKINQKIAITTYPKGVTALEKKARAANGTNVIQLKEKLEELEALGEMIKIERERLDMQVMALRSELRRREAEYGNA